MTVSDVLSFLHTKTKLREQGVDASKDADFDQFNKSFAKIQEDLGVHERIKEIDVTKAVSVTDVHNFSDEQIQEIGQSSDSGGLQEFTDGIESPAKIASTRYERGDLTSDDQIETTTANVLERDLSERQTEMGRLSKGTPFDAEQLRRLDELAKPVDQVWQANLTSIRAILPGAPDDFMALPNTEKMKVRTELNAGLAKLPPGDMARTQLETNLTTIRPQLTARREAYKGIVDAKRSVDTPTDADSFDSYQSEACKISSWALFVMTNLYCISIFFIKFCFYFIPSYYILRIFFIFSKTVV